MFNNLKRGLLESTFFYHLNQSEFRRTVKSFLIMTLAFSIAFTWRETFFDVSQALLIWTTGVEKGPFSSILTSLLITLLCIFLIYLISFYLSDNPKRKQF